MQHLGTTPLETPRLFLRRFTTDDAWAVFRNWGADPVVFQYMTTKIMSTLAEVTAFLDKKVRAYRRADTYYWAIVPKEIGEPVGMVTLTGTTPHGGTANLAYTLGRAWWGQGFAREAAAAVMRFAFEQVGLGLLYGSHFHPNVRSKKTLLALGMHPMGACRSPHSFRRIHPFCEEYMLPAESYFAQRETP